MKTPPFKGSLLKSGLLLGLLSITSPQIAGASTSLQITGDWNVEANWTNGVPNGNYTYVTSGLAVKVPVGVTGYTDSFFVGDAFGGTGSVHVDGGTLHTSFPRLGHIWVDPATGLLQAAASGNLRITGGEFSYGSLDFFMGTLDIEGGVVTGGGDYTNIGLGQFSDVTVNVSSVPGFSTEWTTAKYLQIGNDRAAARINISGADTHLTSQFVRIANDNSTSTGVVNINDASWDTTGITVGDNGNGTLNIQSGATVTGGGNIGLRAGSNGTANVLAGGTWNANSGLSIGYAGTGTLNINGGNLTSAGWSTLGDQGGAGEVTVTSGLWTHTSSLAIGYYGNGVLNVNGGTVAVNSESSGLFIGYETGSHGTVNVTAGELKTRYLYVGEYGAGNLNIEGGLVTTDIDSTVGGSASGGPSAATVTGGAWNVLGDLIVGYGGTGTLTVNGGTVTAANLWVGQYGTGILDINAGTLNVAGQIVVAQYAGSHGTLNYNGGTLNASSIVIGVGSTTVNFNQAGTTIVDFGLTGNLDVNVNANGTTTLTTENTYSGNTTIRSGTLVLAAAASINNSPDINLGAAGEQGTLDVSEKAGFSIGSGQKLTGYGTVRLGAGKTLTIYGMLSPGNSPGVTSVIGDAELDAISTTLMELAGIGGVAGVDFDQFEVSGLLTYGGDLSIQGFGGYDIAQTSAYLLFDFSQKTGGFNSVTVGTTGLVIDNGVWTGGDASANYTFSQASGILEVVSVPEPEAIALVGFGLILLLLRRRRRASLA